ncbi:MAG: bifunctional alpha,alpha-trehalose-phosphate synthase (UDP-forming)/trehalose-phosphatase [Candidatus Thermoplasmatota archaeon]
MLIVSNRLHVSIEKRKGKLHIRPSTGGLASVLAAVHKKGESIWVGWPGIPTAKKDGMESTLLSEFNCYPVSLKHIDVEKYYYGFCNRTLWPLFHYFPRITKYNPTEWEHYKIVNQLFCDRVIELAKPNDIIWVHDYHLMLLPQLLRKALPNATIGFFLHTPFPPVDIFRLLPWRVEILNGLLGADVIGFHTYEYANNFLNNVLCLLGLDHSLGQIIIEDRVVKIDVFPAGIDSQLYSNAVNDAKIQKEIRKLRNRIGEHKVIFSIDRLDYIKGIPERLDAFDTFLERYPEWHEKVILVLVATPSRSHAHEYQLLKKEIDETIGKINGKYATIGWNPILYVSRFLPFSTLAALYVIADAALITPIRDGMNLIAKEYIAASADGHGVLILSEMAGAAKELSEAIIVNPNNKEEIANALNKALTMPIEEQIVRNREMQKRLRFYDVERWQSQFIDRLKETKQLQDKLKARIIDSKIKERLIANYRKSSSRLIFLDYDGTLVPFTKNPEDAYPVREVLNVLEKLANQTGNEIVLITGRDKTTLDKWFGNLDNIELVAEHGVWLKYKNTGAWELIEPLTSGWKKEIRTILELFVDRIPGSFIEEKDFSIAWHYRDVEEDTGLMQAKELMAVLTDISANIEIGVLHGNKVIEVKNVGINKGHAGLRWLSKSNFQFILAIGDDETDEALFRILPSNAYSIKVGISSSHAKFNLRSQKDVLPFLKEFLIN